MTVQSHTVIKLELPRMQLHACSGHVCYKHLFQLYPDNFQNKYNYFFAVRYIRTYRYMYIAKKKAKFFILYSGFFGGQNNNYLVSSWLLLALQVKVVKVASLHSWLKSVLQCSTTKSTNILPPENYPLYGTCTILLL